MFFEDATVLASIAKITLVIIVSVGGRKIVLCFSLGFFFFVFLLMSVWGILIYFLKYFHLIAF